MIGVHPIELCAWGLLTAVALHATTAAMGGLAGRLRRTLADRRGRRALATRLAALQRPPTAPVAWGGWRRFGIAAIATEARDPMGRALIASFELMPCDGRPLPTFVPGQFVRLRCRPGPGRAPVERCYTLSAAPRPDRYRLTVRREPGGRVSSWLHERAARGTVVELSAPAGTLGADVDHERPLLLIAGGIGVTPMLSILEAHAEAGADRPIALAYGVRRGCEVVAKPLLARLAARRHAALRLAVCISRPAPEDRPLLAHTRGDYRVGRIDAGVLRELLVRLRTAGGPPQVLLCGTPAMVESMIAALRALGVDDADITREAFDGAARPADAVGEPETEADSEPCQVAFSRSGRTVTWDPRQEPDCTLATLARRSGVAVAHGCGAGNCGACEVGLARGSVTHRRGPAPRPGRCRPCVAVPRGDVALEA